MDALLDKARLNEGMCNNRATSALFRFDFYTCILNYANNYLLD